MVVKLTVLTNALAFFGKDLARDEKFMHAALDYIEDTLKTAEVVRLLPGFMAGAIGNILAKRLSSHLTVYDTLISVTEQRLQEQTLRKHGQKLEKEVPRQSRGTGPANTISFAIHDLCLHPEYVEPLRQELQSSRYSEFEKTGQGLPLLDSFIKESARLTPVESSKPIVRLCPYRRPILILVSRTVSTRRHALQPFTLSDGTRLEVGDWACTPVRALMQSPSHYPDATVFHGFRFVDPDILTGAANPGFQTILQEYPTKFTDTNGKDDTWHVWGTGRMSCPGRFYAAAVIKVILAQIILHYDCELVDKNAARWFTWRSSMLPKPRTMVTFRPVGE
ncbi:MAG: hypothetical protein Q9204_002142 [Flavoplaca sp. TL-2023a]